MQLTFKKNHLSISSFDSVAISDFTVLTGVNGSGKSHLLQAIEKNHVEIVGLQNARIVLFDYETFKLDNEPPLNAYQLTDEREQAWQLYEQSIKSKARNWRGFFGQDYDAIKTECERENRSLWGYANERVKPYIQDVKNCFNQPEIKQYPHAPGIYSLAKQVPYVLDEFEHDDFIRMYKPIVLKQDFLPHQLGKVFWDYYVKYRNNQVNNYENDVHGKNYDAMSEEQFIQTHGPKPWDIVNKIFESFDSLHYRVNSPEGMDFFGYYQLRLTHTGNPNLTVEFNGLSSGERILMALVASIYKSSSDKNYPDVLLLDEVDASLHPSMMRNMLEVLNDIFVSQGVKVILVTHSPTTIALAPDESIYVMNRSGQNRIEKKSRQKALSILTEGYATLDEGLLLFDEVTRSGTTIVTEGHNSVILKKALELHGINDVYVMTGVEGCSGDSQLRTLFDFLSKVEHKNKVIFVWDCDAKKNVKALLETNNTVPYALAQNPQNQLATKGIENAFPESLFDKFKTTTCDSLDNEKFTFDSKRKRDFSNYIVARNRKSDFAHFSDFIALVERVRNTTA